MANDQQQINLDEVYKRAAFLQATMIDDDGNWLDLHCPKCDCDKIVPCGGQPDLGVEARCYECGHEFVITGNCWKLDPTKVFE